MKIKEINLFKHPFFSDIEFDFTDEEGNIVDTVIIVGENGCGKTQLLNIIYEFSQLSTGGQVSSERRRFVVVLNNEEMEKILTHENLKKNLVRPTGEFVIEQDYAVRPGYWNRIKVMYYSCNENGAKETKTIESSLLFTNEDIKALFKSLYSTVEINYNPKEASAITSKELDQVVEKSVKSGTDLASDIQQLFIDIQNNDANELQTWVNENDGKVPPHEVKNRRISRFKRAFSGIFDNLNYYKIKTENNRKKVIFKKENEEVDISALSSGEKQIVFRGAFLLKDQQSVKGSVVLIDEPEISLHPVWQQKILQYYRNLFTDSKGKQTSQMFIATHSPFIIHNPNRYNDKVLILNKKDTITKAEYSGKYMVIKEPEIIEKAFNINIFNRMLKQGITVFVEGETDEKYFNTYIERFLRPSVDIRFQWIGAYNNKGNAFNTGDSGLNNLAAFLKAHYKMISEKVVLLYDSDTNKQEETFGNISIMRMPINSENTLYEIGVENLLELPNDFPQEEFYKETRKKDKYGAISVIRDLDKTKLCEYICTNDTQRYLIKLETVISKIISNKNGE